MYYHRELLTSLLASAMLTTTLLPAPGPVTRASVIDPASAGRILNAAFSRMPDSGWAMPGADALAAAQNATPVIAVSLTKPGSEPLDTAKMLKARHDRALQNPKPSTISPGIAVPLGMTQSETLITKQISARDITGKHIFAAPATPIGKILVIVIKDAAVYMYACDMNGKLLAAGILENNSFTTMAVEKAAAGFEVELRFWHNATEDPPTPNNA